jgi:hypothetical protein
LRVADLTGDVPLNRFMSSISMWPSYSQFGALKRTVRPTTRPSVTAPLSELSTIPVGSAHAPRCV